MSPMSNSDHSPSVGNMVGLLTERIEPLCRELLPNGRRAGAEWRVGSLHGAPGQYLGVHLVGAKAGTWADFAGDERGDALDLVNRIGALAEEQGHHPDLHLAWGRVGVEIWTHKIDGLTESDFILAAKIDALRQA